MSRNPFEPLTGQMFYVLLALQQPRCGVEIMEQVRSMTKERIKLGPGTLYTLLARFQETGMIQETQTEGRKRSYQLTSRGKAALLSEYRRLRNMVQDYDFFWQEEEKT